MTKELSRIIRKYMKYNDIMNLRFMTLMLFRIVCIICIVICCQPQETVMAYTYFTQWWLGYFENAGPGDSAGVLNIYYTYPNSVFVGQNFSVGITLQYVNDQRAVLDWIVFSGVSVGLKDILELGDPSVFPDDISSSIVDNRSRLVTPGQQYSYSLTLAAPQSPGKYVIFPRWNAFYGPGTTVDNNFDWKMEYYYNQSEFREFGVVEPEDELPSIDVIERKGQNTTYYPNLSLLIHHIQQSNLSKCHWQVLRSLTLYITDLHKVMDQHNLMCPLIQPMQLRYPE
jgi:hypothetical protein